MWKDFKKFALKGNVVDLAIGVVIGGAFGKIVTSLVSNIIMPIVGLIIGRIDFSNLYIPLSLRKVHYASLQAAQAAGVATLNIGLFIDDVVDFLIVAFSIFFVIRLLSKLHKKQEVAKTTKKCPYCCTDIALEAVRCPNCTSELDD